MDPTELVRIASTYRERAYAPYSGFHVGAAVLTSDGRVHGGCNVENASYGLTICAERAALFAAAADAPPAARGSRSIAALAVVSGPGAAMCGACRQVLVEFASDDTPIYLASGDGSFRERRVADLLPGAFTAGENSA